MMVFLILQVFENIIDFLASELALFENLVFLLV